MKMKITILITAALVAAVFTLGLIVRHQAGTITDLDQNVNYITKTAKAYKVKAEGKDSLNALSIQKLNLDVKRYLDYRQKDVRLISDLGLKLKRAKSVVTSQAKTIYDLKSNVRDSIVYRDSIRVDTLRCIEQITPWYSFSGCIYPGDVFEGSMTSIDSLVYIEHIIPKRFLFIRWGVKERRQEIISKNPDTKILSAEFISLKK